MSWSNKTGGINCNKDRAQGQLVCDDAILLIICRKGKMEARCLTSRRMHSHILWRHAPQKQYRLAAVDAYFESKAALGKPKVMKLSLDICQCGRRHKDNPSANRDKNPVNSMCLLTLRQSQLLYFNMKNCCLRAVVGGCGPGGMPGGGGWDFSMDVIFF